MEKINQICQSVLKITDKEIEHAQQQINEQSLYVNPLDSKKQKKFNDLGEHNQRVLKSFVNLKKAIENKGENPTPERKVEKFDEIMEMLERASKENWNDWEIHRGLVRITAYE